MFLPFGAVSKDIFKVKENISENHGHNILRLKIIVGGEELGPFYKTLI